MLTKALISRLVFDDIFSKSGKDSVLQVNTKACFSLTEKLFGYQLSAISYRLLYSGIWFIEIDTVPNLFVLLNLHELRKVWFSLMKVFLQKH